MKEDSATPANGQKKKKIRLEEEARIFNYYFRRAKKNKIGNYDCLVPVSGGKDGTYVAYQLREKYASNILTVTSRPPLELDVGEKNLKNFIQKILTTYISLQIKKQ